MSESHAILIVDDEAEIRDTLSEYFEVHGFVPHQAADGTEMRAVLAEVPISVVLLDLHLGSEDGLQLCRELQENPGLGIIMLTGSADLIDRRTISVMST